MLKGKTALITGSTSGIGLGLARAFAAEGANVVLNGFGDAAEIETIRAGLAAEHKVAVTYSPADMERPDEIAAMIADAEKQFGAIDVLCPNAGIQHVAPVDEFPVDRWDAIIAIILSSAFHVIRAGLPRMRAKGWGRIIMTASAHALNASPYKAAYVAAKHGLGGLTKVVALETAQQGITVNAICPGYVWTPLAAKQIPDTMKARNLTADQVKRDVMLAAQPTKEFVTVEEIAGLAVFLCSDAARNMTGSLITMDGGWTAA
jgi:3-hydroxybutyrate dehydrogenase